MATGKTTISISKQDYMDLVAEGAESAIREVMGAYEKLVRINVHQAEQVLQGVNHER